ncbi:MAG: GntR family transcriptional regulator [Acidobacteriia bacterium]|nr:GntR family transcriptional regulator [Terriglobia bacterium]
MHIQVISKAEQVRQAILVEILSGKLRPGQRLLEARLSKELGVSQATVNAALQDLHNQGLVTKLLNRSTNVSRYTAAEIEKLFAVRAVLEPAAVGSVAANWSPEARECLAEQVERMRRAARAKDLPKFCLADYTFHQEIYRLSDNSFLIQACQAIAAAPFAYILCDHLEALPTDYLALAEDHHELILAIEEGPEAAVKLTRARIEEWRQHSLRALESPSLVER